MSSSLFFRGVQEFNHGHFFEAHELWEELWSESVGEEKRFYQGLVQIAAGYHKLSLAQYSGARKLLERGQQLLAEFPLTYARIDLGFLLGTVQATLYSLGKNQEKTPLQVPLIRPLSSPC